MKLRVLTTIIAGTLCAAPLVASADQGQFFVTPFVGNQYFDNDRSDTNEGVLGIGGEYQFSDHFGLELDYTRTMNELDAGGIDGDYDRASLDGIYYFGTGGFRDMYTPYFKLGAGHARYDFDGGVSDDQETDVSAGLGVRIKIIDRLFLRPEVKAIHELDDSKTNYLASVGLSFAFGGEKKAEPAPAPAPVVAPAPVDSDGDGVYDDKDKCPNTPRGREVKPRKCALISTSR
jgi:OOP family OmpA-OmpF porin